MTHADSIWANALQSHSDSLQSRVDSLHGKWLQQNPHVYDMILREFDLPPERTTAKYAIHWDIGQSWR